MLDKVIERRNADSVMGLGEHLDELRKRVLMAVVGLLPILIVALIYGRALLDLIMEPALKALRLDGQAGQMQVTSAMEAFSAYFYVVVLVTLIVGGPWVLYQLWRFVAPGLYSNERRFAYILAPLSVTLTIVGVLLMYFVMLPLALSFLFNFASTLGAQKISVAPVPEGIVLPTLPVLAADPPAPTPGQTWINRELNALRVCVAPASEDGQVRAVIMGTDLSNSGTLAVHPKLSEYIELFLTLALVFALTFQLPVVLLLLGWVGVVNVGMLRKHRKYAFAGAVVLAAVASPTGDPGSLAVLQLPMYLLYEFSILLLWLLPASRVAGTPKTNADDDASPTDATGP
ncbi:MAG: twin-arginine translocase subunit TatC [Phycisphaerales bacterium]|nr:twin-arginine translocase subunit TatC [Phycisphaerales bacterium]